MLPALHPSYVQHLFDRIDDRERELLDVQIVECLKFLVITSATPGRRIAVTPEVDTIWHELILQTASYMSLCTAMPGGRYLHHASIMPDEYADRVGDEEFIREFVQWIPDYVQNFGEFDEERSSMWTVTRFLMEQMNYTLDEVNELGRTEVPEVELARGSAWRALGQHRKISSALAL